MCVPSYKDMQQVHTSMYNPSNKHTASAPELTHGPCSPSPDASFMLAAAGSSLSKPQPLVLIAAPALHVRSVGSEPRADCSTTGMQSRNALAPVEVCNNMAVANDPLLSSPGLQDVRLDLQLGRDVLVSFSP